MNIKDEYLIKSKSIVWGSGDAYWFGIPGDGNNWTRYSNEADVMTLELATRLSDVLRAFGLVIEVVEA